MKKKILFVINTLSKAGAENALMELLRKLGSPEYEVSLYVLTGQGELVGELPEHVRLLNPTFCSQSVLTGQGRRELMKKVSQSFFKNGRIVHKLLGVLKSLWSMLRERRVQIDKLFWRVLSDGAERLDVIYDLAVAWIEGGSAYYVADHVKARKKAVLVHIDYKNAGYTKAMDQDCFASYDRIFTVSAETREHFLDVYPEYEARMEVFHNLINQDLIRRRARERGGFEDGYEGFRILSVGRLTWQKGYDIAIEAMEILKKKPYDIRWYVLGDGDQKKALTRKIQALQLGDSFLLLGQKDNPYPYYAQADLYVHATRYEGKSIAIQEAQTLGCAVIVSDCNGNREQIEDGKDGLLCRLTPQAVADCIEGLYLDGERRRRLGAAAERKEIFCEKELRIFQDMVE